MSSQCTFVVTKGPKKSTRCTRNGRCKVGEDRIVCSYHNPETLRKKSELKKKKIADAKMAARANPVEELSDELKIAQLLGGHLVGGDDNCGENISAS